MKDFTQIEEGLLAGQDSTMKAGDKISKKIAEVEAIRKNLFLLDILWDRSNGGNNKQDFFGKDIKIGDVVLAIISEGMMTNDWSYGIVIKEPDKYGECKIITGSAHVEGTDFDDPYNDCMSCYVAANKMFVLARHKKAKQILQILENVI